MVGTVVFMCLQLLFIILSKGLARDESRDVIWCTVSDAEQRKCLLFRRAVNQTGNFELGLQCKQMADKDQCMNKLDIREADLMTLDPGEIFIAGRYNSLVPILEERYGEEEANGYYAVAVIPSSVQIRSLDDLQDRKACFPGVGQMAGWVIPMATLLDRIDTVTDCNNLVKTAAGFFGSSCAPNSLIDKYNPTGDNPVHMCNLCAGRKATHCSGSDPFSYFEGAFKCLLRGGEIAFLKHTTINEMINKYRYRNFTRSHFRLLCQTGVTSSIDGYRNCNWGFVPAHAVVTTSAILPHTREKFQRFLLKAAEMFGERMDYNKPSRGWGNTFNSTYQDDISFKQPSFFGGDRRVGKNDLNTASFKLFGSEAYGDYSDLLFQDITTRLVIVDSNRQTFTSYLGNALKYFNKLQRCPVPAAKLCVVSEQELKKCHKMKTAFRAQMLKPELTCIKGYNHINCMDLIKDGLADLVVLDTGDIYKAGQQFDLIPIIAEQYNLDDASYYVVAVAKQPDKDTDLLYLKGKRSCHIGIGTAAGWVVPMSFLLSNERMRTYGCNSAHAAAEFFQKSCVPGALSREYTVGEWGFNNLCDLCHGSSYSFCARDSSEPYFGNTGAMRCLVEGGGQIAFVKHTTILENTAGKNPNWWSRPMMPDDFELLCRDGTRAMYTDYEQCNLGRVASNALVTSKYKSRYVINAYIDLFLYAQQYYGSKYSDEYKFKMFVSEDGYHDLIFQDATQQLKAVPREKQDYKNYLGYDFTEAVKMVDCTAGTSRLRFSILIFLLLFTSIYLKSKLL